MTIRKILIASILLHHVSCNIINLEQDDPFVRSSRSYQKKKGSKKLKKSHKKKPGTGYPQTLSPTVIEPSEAPIIMTQTQSPTVTPIGREPPTPGAPVINPTFFPPFDFPPVSPVAPIAPATMEPAPFAPAMPPFFNVPTIIEFPSFIAPSTAVPLLPSILQEAAELPSIVPESKPQRKGEETTATKHGAKKRKKAQKVNGGKKRVEGSRGTAEGKKGFRER
mmetsp:Transcript_14047/g.21457  ORF Transcript_14047/g.21457 Transcript_14047/m.21457 type:complete len:222 (-) Transcript_14047:1748-2413(-)